MTDETLFAAALEQADPAAYLDAHCPDPAVRRRVDELLAAHAAAGSFLNHPAVGADVTTALPPSDPGATRTQASTDPDATADPRTGPADPAEALAFLKPPTRPGSLGRLAHYEVLEVLGSGGFGTVMKAFDDRLHRVVAVKVLAPQLAASGAARTRFEREARSAAAVRDEHVVNVYAVSEPGDPLPYLVMELVAGQTLQAKLDKAGPLPPKEVLRIGSQIARGLAAAHKQGLIHRDIKPANILLENGVERVKVTDFGLARAADDASISQSGLVAGTPMFMSPEQARGDTLDTRSDLFSLGSVLYVLCTGRPPFRAETTLAVLKRVVEDDPRPVRDVNPEVPRWLADVVAKLHAKAPADRFQTAAEVAELLSGYLAELQQQGTVVARPGIAPPRKAAACSWWWFLVPLVLCGLLSAAALLPDPETDGISRHETLEALVYGFGFVTAAGVVATALLSVVAGQLTGATAGRVRRWFARARSFTVAAGTAAAANGGAALVLPVQTIEVTVIPSIGLESVLPHRDGKPVGDWVDVSNGQTLRLRAGHYKLEGRFAPGVTSAFWDVTTQRADGPTTTRMTSRMAEFDLAPGRRVAVRCDTTMTRAVGSWGEYVDPLGDCKVSEDAGGLTLTVPAGNHDLSNVPGGNMNGPRVLRDVAGDFEARVVVPPLPKPKAGTSSRTDGVSYVGAGLAVLSGDQILLRLFRAGLATNNDGAPFAQVEWFPPGVKRGHEAKYIPDGPVHLRLRRVGDTLHPAFSVDGKSWTDLSPVTDVPLAAKLRVGVAAVSTYHQEVAFRLDRPVLEPTDGFTPLFDGKTLAGWKTHPDAPGGWRVDAGHLVSTRAAGYLFSEKGDWQDFHLRAEVHVSQGGNSGVFFRTPFRLEPLSGPETGLFAPAGWYEADLFWGPVAKPGRIRDLGETAETLAEPNQWLTLEVIARGNHFVTRVNGKEAVNVVDARSTFARGHFALQAFNPGTSVRYRKIEVKDLSPSAAPPAAVAPFTPAEAKAHQEAWAKHLGVPVEFTNDVGMTFRLVPPGEFTLGSTAEQVKGLRDELARIGAAAPYLDAVSSEAPPVRVRRTQPVYLATREVEVGQFRRFVAATKHKTDAETGGGGQVIDPGTNAYRADPKADWKAPGYAVEDRQPVTQVSWNDAKAFCDWLAKTDRVQARLPTEAEWEYACRAGSEGTHSFADAFDARKRVVCETAAPRPTGSLPANGFGLFDLEGNVWEWVGGWARTDATVAPLTDPDVAPPDGTRMFRGGGFPQPHHLGRPATRFRDKADARTLDTGFRVAIAGDLKAAAERAGWRSLFNGTDLTGWKTLPGQPGDWKVEGGELVGRGPEVSHLVTTRGGYTNFRLRAEVKVNAGGNSGIFARTVPVLGDGSNIPPGVECEINPGSTKHPTGSLRPTRGLAFTASAPSPPAGEWATIELRVEGRQVDVEVNGRPVVRGTVPDAAPGQGHIALQVYSPKTEVRFRKVEVMELPPAAPGGAVGPARRDLIAAREKELAAAKARFDAGLNTRREVAEAEAALIEAKLDGAPGAATVRLLGQLVEKHDVRREVVAARIEAGVLTPDAVNPIDGDIAVTKARLAVAKRAEPPPAAAPFDTEKAGAFQEMWARHLGVLPEVSNDLGMRFRVIPPGAVSMGSSEEEVEYLVTQAPDLKDAPAWLKARVRAEAPVRVPSVREPFLMGAHEVTVGQFREFVTDTGHKTTAESTGGGVVWDNAAKKWNPDKDAVWHNPKFAGGENHPVVFVTAADARAFCAWLGKRDGRTYALPTEEQWEYACRAGTTTRWWFGGTADGMKDAGWTVEHSGGKHQPVGQKRANPFGLFDVYGNAAELATTPQGEVVERGGQANETAWRARSAWRNPVTADDHPHARRGFRVVIVGDPAPRPF